MSSNPPISVTVPSSTPTLEGSQVGGIVGVFASSASPPPSAPNYIVFYDIFRFYENGLVIGAKVGIDTDSINESWDKISIWFNEDSDSVAQGTYHILNERIWFNMSDTGHMLATDFSGSISDGKLLLNYDNRRDGSQGENIEYISLDSDPP